MRWSHTPLPNLVMTISRTIFSGRLRDFVWHTHVYLRSSFSIIHTIFFLLFLLGSHRLSFVTKSVRTRARERAREQQEFRSHVHGGPTGYECSAYVFSFLFWGLGSFLPSKIYMYNILKIYQYSRIHTRSTRNKRKKKNNINNHIFKDTHLRSRTSTHVREIWLKWATKTK